MWNREEYAASLTAIVLRIAEQQGVELGPEVLAKLAVLGQEAAEKREKQLALLTASEVALNLVASGQGTTLSAGP